MIVISSGQSGRSILPRVEDQLKLLQVEMAVFDKVESNPLKATVEAGAAFARENNCDFVIALGGGSVMDAAKVMAMNATNPGDLWDYVYGGTGKGIFGKNKALPMVAITTTAGTGSEVDAFGVVTNPRNQRKSWFRRSGRHVSGDRGSGSRAYAIRTSQFYSISRMGCPFS